MKKILIIDDNQKDLFSYEAIFNNKELAYKALTADTGALGLELARKEKPDVIIIDVKLPDIDGFSVCKRLKSDTSLNFIPVIMISAWGAQKDNRLNSLKAGAEIFLSKPINVDELLAQVNVLIRIKTDEDKLRKERNKFEKLANDKTNELKELNNYLNLQIKKMPVGLITWDVDFKVISWNPAATQIFGYGAKEAFGKTPFETILAPELQQTVSELWKKLLKGDKSILNINKNLTKKRETIVCEWTNTPLIDEDKKVIGVMSMVKDITPEYYQQRLEKGMNTLNKALLSKTGMEFLKQFVIQLCKVLEADMAYIGLLEDDQKMISSISAAQNGNLLENFNHPIKETACEEVTKGQICSFPKNITKLFPNDKFVKGLKAEAVIGLPLFDTQNKVIGIVSSVFKNPNNEINYHEQLIQIFTTRIAAEIERISFDQKIRESEKQFREMVEKFPYPMALTKGDQFIYLNQKYTETFGYSLDDIRTFNDWFKKAYPDEKYRELVRSSWNEAVEIARINHEEIKTQEWNLRTLSGQIKTCEYNTVPLADSSLIVMNDITKRKRSELIQTVLYQISNAANTTNDLAEFIKVIREDLGAVLDTTNFFVAFHDEEKDILYTPYEIDEKDEFTSWPAAKSLTGYVIKNKKPLFATKQDIKQLHKEGKINLIGTIAEVWVGVPLILEGKVLGAFVVQNYDDPNTYSRKDVQLLEFISHQISISIQRIQNKIELGKALEKALESDRLKSVFLSTMSHELRTPLNAIIGFSELINAKTKPEDIERFVKTIYNSGNLLLELVEGLFDITLIEAGEIKIEKEFHNLKLIIDDVADVIDAERKKTNKQNIKFHISEYPFNNELQIYTDSYKLKQILLNLLKNALKFTHEGAIRLDLSKETIGKESFVRFVVRDTGIGIPKNKLNFIFDIFRQADDSHTRKYGGAGIGLSVTKKLTELLGGNIEVKSVVNKGTTFYVNIPLTANNIKPKKTPLNNHKVEIIYPNKTILIAEDDDSSMTLLKIYLKKLGVKILHATNGKEALEVFRSKPDQIDLILMDINMPLMNGYEAVTEIKKINSAVPIIAQTAYAISGDREKALQNGCDDYLSKPINSDQLIHMIKKFL